MSKVEIITSDGLRWESDASDEADFGDRLKFQNVISVRVPRGSETSGWHVQSSQVVAFRLKEDS